MNTNNLHDEESLSHQNILKLKQIQTQLQSSIHQHKKALLQAKSQLQYERSRADGFQEKYKNAIRYQNQEKQLKTIMNELNDKLKIKQNEMLDLLKSQQQKKLKISQLQSDYEQLKNLNEQMQEKFKQMQDGAVSAIMQKDTIISELQQKLHLVEFNESANSSNLNVALMELQQKYKELEDRSQATKTQLESLLEQKEEDIRQLEQKSQHQKEKLQERISRLQQEIQDYERHIEHINEQKVQQENLQEKYYHLEEKLRKSEKRNSQVQLLLSDLKKEYEQFLAKYAVQEEQTKTLGQQIKSLKLKIKQLHSDVKDKQKSNYQLKILHEKNILQLNKKISILENDKKKSHQSIQAKNLEIETLKISIQEKINQLNEQKSRKMVSDTGKNTNDSRMSLAAQIKNVNAEKLVSPVKMIKKQSEQQNRLIQKYKHQISDLEQNNVLLSKKLEQKTKELQQLRQRLVSQSGSASRSEEQAKLLCVIEDLNNHIKKLQNSMITQKYKYAQDENFWKMKEKNYKVEIENVTKQFKKERSELLQRIDRMKKTVSGKVKKMDYYQSAFK